MRGIEVREKRSPEIGIKEERSRRKIYLISCYTRHKTYCKPGYA
ncbi:hypothetical protein [Kamptonema sp. UHCC 0994]|nr:hypothetical protein [Kamptonema sp. UHCC 0994]MDF0553086.1 hypothetical protein [Kamptonema sp. UHCC 0994]